MQLTGEVILLLLSYSYLVVLVSAILGGEELIIFFSILAGHGLLSIWKVALVGFLGILASDIFWFLLARSSVASKLKDKVKGHFLYKHTNAVVERFSHKHDYVYLVLTKFLYGLRIVSIVKVSRRGGTFSKFILNDSLAILSWAVIMLSIGWGVGKLFFTTINLFDSIHKILILAVCIIVALYLVEAVIKSVLQRTNDYKPKP